MIPPDTGRQRPVAFSANMRTVPSDTVLLSQRPVHRMGFGAMQLRGPGVLGPPGDHDQALTVLRRAVDAGVNHIDTAQFYGPNVANELIHEALHPYPADLVLVSKVGAARNEEGHWLSAQRPAELRAGVEANLATLQLEQIPVVNLRRHPESEVPFGEQVEAMMAMCREGLIGGIGLSNVTLDEFHVAQGQTEVACVQNAFILIDRSDQDVFDACHAHGVPYVPRAALRRRRLRWLWPGCCISRPPCSSFRALRRSGTWRKTWPQPTSSSMRRPLPRCPRWHPAAPPCKER